MPKRSSLYRVLLAVAVGLLLFAPDAPAAPRPNVLVIVIDTLRSDALGAWGQKLPTSPNIDALAKSSVRFDTAWTQYTWTLPSFVTYMTSTFARSHGWTYKMGQLDTYRVMAPPAPTLAETFRAAGWSTVGVYANEHLRADLGFGRGFDTWTRAPEAGTMKNALAALSAWPTDGKPNFLYVHLMAPHVPLVPSAAAQAAIGAKLSIDPTRGMGYDHWLTAPEAEKPARLAELRLAYLASVRDADTSVGRLLAALDATGERGNTVITLFSDHGELVGEHGQAGHGPMIWEELGRVPLMVSAPGYAARRVTDRVGRLVDVAPTLTALAGLPPAKGWQGTSLLDASRPLAVVERDHLVGFTQDGKYKVVDDRAKEVFFRAYDLTTDPREATGTTERTLPWVTTLSAGSAAWRASTPVGKNDGALLGLEGQEREETLEQLRALGYIQ